jgi:GntR family transcriptional repressor for pyruvate dehydrogenase complex
VVQRPDVAGTARPGGGRVARPRRQPVALPGIQPVLLPRVSDEVAEQIRRLIVGERLAEGARLPAERELADRFGVSRPMVSQALRMLSLMGLVEIRRGSGAFVLRRPQAMVAASVGLLLDLHGSVGDLAELRLWLETLGVVHAAQRPAPTMAGLRDALQRLAGATGSASAWIAADTVFHATAVQAAGNTYLTALYEGVHTAVLAREHEHWVRTETEPTWLAPPAVPLLDLHRAIYDAVAAGDAEAARGAVLRHHDVMLEHLAAAPGMPPMD